jgi:threonine/homoserine/homoserine lactone efflux protein
LPGEGCRVWAAVSTNQLWPALAAYVALAALITITPGVDNFLVLRFATVGGRRAALSAGLGISLGCLVWAAASVLGLTAALAASHLAFAVVRGAGALYLCWLGSGALWRSRRRTPAGDDKVPTGDSDALTARRKAFRAGLATNLLNPKAGVFFLSVLPPFLPAGYPTLPTAGLFVTVHLSVGMVWFALIAAVVDRARAFLHKPTVQRRLDQAAGLVFIALAVKVAAESL